MTQQTSLDPNLCYCMQPDVQYVPQVDEYECRNCNKLFTSRRLSEVTRQPGSNRPSIQLIVAERQAEKARVEAVARAAERDQLRQSVFPDSPLQGIINTPILQGEQEMSTSEDSERLVQEMTATIAATIAGSVQHEIYVHDGDGIPIPGVSVTISIDSDWDHVMAGPLLTDANGRVTFILDSGTTYYVWKDKAGYTFPRAEPFTIPAAQTDHVGDTIRTSNETVADQSDRQNALARDNEANAERNRTARSILCVLTEDMCVGAALARVVNHPDGSLRESVLVHNHSQYSNLSRGANVHCTWDDAARYYVITGVPSDGENRTGAIQRMWQERITRAAAENENMGVTNFIVPTLEGTQEMERILNAGSRTPEPTTPVAKPLAPIKTRRLITLAGKE